MPSAQEDQTRPSSNDSLAVPSVTTVDEKEKSEEASTGDNDATDVVEYPQGWKLWVVYIATLLTMFLVPLDMTIIATAILKITKQLHSLDEVGWYGSAFFLTLGKSYKYSPIKIAYIASVFMFELGSLICGVAQNSQMLIAGRVITGCGGAVHMEISRTVPCFCPRRVSRRTRSDSARGEKQKSYSPSMYSWQRYAHAPLLDTSKNIDKYNDRRRHSYLLLLSLPRYFLLTPQSCVCFAAAPT